jgi:putative membrane protein
MKLQDLLMLACAAAFTVACGGDTRNSEFVQDGDGAIGTSGETGIARDDRDFVHHMLETGMAEVELGRMAQTRGTSTEVKQFGRQMVEDHSRAADQLERLANEHRLQPDAPNIDREHQDLIDRLSKLSGAEFDRAYIDAMVDGHQDVIDSLQGRVDERDRLAVLTGQQPRDVNVKPEPADNPLEARLNEWAAQTLPVVKGHLDLAQEIDDSLDQANRRSASR